MMHRSLPRALVLFLALLCLSAEGASAIELILPTSNDGIFRGDDSAFYQRTASGRDDPWKGGRYGYSRNPRSTREGMIYTRFHEGVDIRPLYRDARGEPLDSVVSIDRGRVVHANANRGESNYGRYVVVEHIWDGSPYYSLYAHLNEVWVEAGQEVEQGVLLGRLGYTGHGINRARAHLHFEITMMMNSNFQGWYKTLWANDSNEHGPYNGMNLVGLDVAAFYMAHRDNPRLTMEKFLSKEEVHFKVILPRSERLDLLNRYPWLQQLSGEPLESAWEIWFNYSGIPLRVTSSVREVNVPEVSEVEMSNLSYSSQTKGLVGGRGGKYTLSSWGRKFMDLIATPPAEDLVE